jgi:lysophospholipase L1-like esterase
MKYFFCFLFAISSACAYANPVNEPGPKLYKANNPLIKYVGRIVFDKPEKPKFWAGGVYVQATFEGTSLEIFVNDEVLGGNNHNYIEIAIDSLPPVRMKLTGKKNDIKVTDNLSPGRHTVIICKDTESGIGYMEFVGLKCGELLPTQLPSRKIEYIGDSITGGTGSDQSLVKCDQGQWYDQHNAYMSYGPIVSRQLNTQWHLSSVAGLGLIHSCCNITLTMPEAFDKIYLRNDSLQWDFSKYVPDVVTICLGQNDGKQDSVAFCSAYVDFIRRIRSVYPKADIVCLSSPMANAELTAMLKKYIVGIQQYMNSSGDKKVSHYFFSRSFNDGCGGHPSMAQHQLIADELSGYLKGLEGW